MRVSNLGVDSAMTSVLGEKNRIGRKFGSDKFHKHCETREFNSVASEFSAIPFFHE